MSKKISDFSALTPLDPTDLLEVVHAGVNYKTTVEDINAAPLGADRTVDLNGHALRFNQNGGTNINATFDPTADAENITFYALNSTANTNVAASQIQSTPTQAVFYTFANFQDGVKVARIDGYADTDESEIEYTADTHTFVGAVILPTSDPGVEGALWNNAGTPAISEGPGS